jgi:DNA relaxase NicK
MEFDWYSATLKGEPREILAALVEGQELADVVPCRALNGYERAAQVRRGSEVLGAVQWGGNSETVHAFGSGAAAPHLAEVMRERFPEHRVTRADVREDYDGEDVWSQLYGLALGVADEFQVKTRQHGDFHRGEDGRTVYVGSRHSPVQLRVYEKGRQLPEYKRPYWVRSELMVLPAKLEQRRAFAVAVPAEFYGASRWSKAYFERVTGCEVERCRAGTVHRQADDDRAEFYMLRQYGGLLERLAGRLGSWGALGDHLGERLRAERAEQAEVRQGLGAEERKSALAEAQRKLRERESKRGQKAGCP